MSGMRPTGRLHLGHYFGALVNYLRFQEKYDSYFLIADWHALTTKYQASREIPNNIREIVADWLSVGIDPEKATIYVQSAIPEIAELHLLFSMLTPHNWVEREPTLKDMVRMLAANEQEAWERVTYGLLGYPVLQAADILVFKASLVPVGKDQESHLEFARDVARKFNGTYGVDFFPEPKPEFTETPLLKGIDGQKMGKSYGNDIKIADTESDTGKRIGQAVTDRTRIAKSQPGHTDLCEVPWPLYQVFGKGMLEQVKAECEGAEIGCVACKARLGKLINEFFAPYRERREKLIREPEKLREIIEYGNAKARKIARQTLGEVHEIMGMVNSWS